MSQVVYLLSALPTAQEILQKINSLLYEFLWDSKSEKIKRTEMINEYDKGGLKMIDIQSLNTSLKIKWVQSYLKCYYDQIAENLHFRSIGSQCPKVHDFQGISSCDEGNWFFLLSNSTNFHLPLNRHVPAAWLPRADGLQ